MSTSESNNIIWTDWTDWNPKLAENWAHRNIFVTATSCALDNSGRWLQDIIPWLEEMQYAWLHIFIYILFLFRTGIWNLMVDQSFRKKFIKFVLLSTCLINFCHWHGVTCSFPITLTFIVPLLIIFLFVLS